MGGDIETWKGYPYIGGLKKKLVNGKGDLDGTMRMWRWSDGTDFDYTPWNTGQPDNDRGNEDVIIYNYHSNRFHDVYVFHGSAVYKKPEPKTCAGVSNMNVTYFLISAQLTFFVQLYQHLSLGKAAQSD